MYCDDSVVLSNNILTQNEAIGRSWNLYIRSVSYQSKVINSLKTYATGIWRRSLYADTSFLARLKTTCSRSNQSASGGGSVSELL